MIEFVLNNFLAVAVTLSMLILGTSVLLTMSRLFMGPTVFDRIMSFDNIAVSIVGMVTLLSIKWNSDDYLDIILLFTIIGFISTVAFCLFLHRVYRPHSLGARLGQEEGSRPRPRRRSLFRRRRKKR